MFGLWFTNNSKIAKSSLIEPRANFSKYHTFSFSIGIISSFLSIPLNSWDKTEHSTQCIEHLANLGPIFCTWKPHFLQIIQKLRMHLRPTTLLVKLCTIFSSSSEGERTINFCCMLDGCIQIKRFQDLTSVKGKTAFKACQTHFKVEEPRVSPKH